MDTTLPVDLADTPAMDALRRRQARRARWSRIGGGLVLAAVAIRGGAALLSINHATTCDASEVQSALTDLVNQAVVKGGGHATLATLDHMVTLDDGAKLKRCTARVVLSDHSAGKLTYHVDPKNVVIDGLE